jgi:hypothetical protein
MSGKRVIGPARPPHLMPQPTEDEYKAEKRHSTAEMVRNRSRSPVPGRENHIVLFVWVILASLTHLEAIR